MYKRQVYGGLAAAALRPALLHRPYLLEWAAIYAPLLAFILWRGARRDDSSLPARAANVLAACLMALAAYSDGLRGQTFSPAALQACAALTAYFMGTLLYVRTMIRRRGQRPYLAASLGYHAALLGLAWGLSSPGLGLFCAFLLARAALMPALLKRGVPVTPKRVGLLEAGSCSALLYLVLTHF